MAVKVTPHLVQLAFEAALKSFWRKESLRKFLRQSHVAESHLATWAPEESKRDFLDRTFAALQRNDKGKAVIGAMAIYLADQSSFPDLRNWEDSSVKILGAQNAVNELKVYIARQTEEIRTEREREAVRARAREEREVAQRQRVSIVGLGLRLDDLAPQMGTAPGGYAFQDWFYDFLAFSEIESRRPYNTGGRQIDGSITVDGTTYLVELKFTASQAGSPDIDIFEGRLIVRPIIQWGYSYQWLGTLLWRLLRLRVKKVLCYYLMHPIYIWCSVVLCNYLMLYVGFVVMLLKLVRHIWLSHRSEVESWAIIYKTVYG